MWFGLFVEVGLLEGHFPEGCFLCLWKVLIREVELGKEMNLIAVQLFGRVRGIITIIPLSCSPWMASLGWESTSVQGVPALWGRFCWAPATLGQKFPHN